MNFFGGKVTSYPTGYTIDVREVVFKCKLSHCYPSLQILDCDFALKGLRDTATFLDCHNFNF